jgi:hypothetical protein
MRRSGRPTSRAPCQRGASASMPRSRPPVSGTAGSSAVGLSPCDQVRSGPRPRPADLLRQRPGRGLWALVAPARSDVDAAPCIGEPPGHSHTRPHRTAPPVERKRRAPGPDDTPCTPSGPHQTCSGPVTAGTPVRPPRGSFVGCNRAARDRSERGPSGLARAAATLNTPGTRTNGPCLASTRRSSVSFTACSFRDGRRTRPRVSTSGRLRHRCRGLTVAVRVQLDRLPLVIATDLANGAPIATQDDISA